ncbi:MAG: hypothetical protein ACI93T_002222 [Porticoccaceae bacterium]|jgi:hypothetical protein
MTTRKAKPVSLPFRCRRSIALAAVIGATMLFATNADAQTNAASGNTQGTGTNAAATGSTVGNQELFSSTIDDFSTPEGRFTTSGLANQPTAGGNNNSIQQNAFNNARNLQRLNSQFNRSNQNRNTGNTQGTRTIRPSLRLGFTPKPRPTEDLRKSLDKQLNALATRLPQLTDGRSEYAFVKFDLGKPGEVVLSGSVSNDGAARLLAIVLRMEPGVSSVRNDLKVATATSTK